MTGENFGEIDKVYRSLPLWLAREYLEEIGGTAQNENFVQGAGWSAALSTTESIGIGALRIIQLRVVFRGAPDALPALIARFEAKALRAGG